MLLNLDEIERLAKEAEANPSHGHRSLIFSMQEAALSSYLKPQTALALVSRVREAEAWRKSVIENEFEDLTKLRTHIAVATGTLTEIAESPHSGVGTKQLAKSALARLRAEGG